MRNEIVKDQSHFRTMYDCKNEWEMRNYLPVSVLRLISKLKHYYTVLVVFVGTKLYRRKMSRATDAGHIPACPKPCPLIHVPELF